MRARNGLECQFEVATRTPHERSAVPPPFLGAYSRDARRPGGGGLARLLLLVLKSSARRAPISYGSFSSTALLRASTRAKGKG